MALPSSCVFKFAWRFRALHCNEVPEIPPCVVLQMVRFYVEQSHSPCGHITHGGISTMATKLAHQQRKKSRKSPPKLSRTKRPDGMSLEDWQIALRREHGRTQDFDIKNVGDDPIFSEFLVRN